MLIVQTLVPLRKEPADSAEMVTQMHMGETGTLLDSVKQWRKIRLDLDGYEGWLDEKAIIEINSAWIESRPNSLFFREPLGLSQITRKNRSKISVPLSIGSRIHLAQNTTGEQSYVMETGDWKLETSPKGWFDHTEFQYDNVLKIADLFLGVPYLWGGKSYLGIDCSGFTQLVFELCGKQIPRDAWQQQEAGTKIDFLRKKPGDLAFFSNENGKVIHVGIVLDGDLIRHAHGWVRDDLLTDEGIIDIETKKRTHSFYSVVHYS